MIISGSIDSASLNDLKHLEAAVRPRTHIGDRGVGKSAPVTPPPRFALRAWDLDSLECQRTLMLRDGVHGLLARRGELWALDVKHVTV